MENNFTHLNHKESIAFHPIEILISRISKNLINMINDYH